MYQNAMIGWMNHIRSGVVFAGSETTVQPAVNLQSDHGAEAWQTAGATNSWLTVDAGAAVSWRALLLARTNLTPAATMRWRIGPRESVVEEIPALVLDGPDTVPTGLACTRSGTATRVNASGRIEEVAADTLRWDYDPLTLEMRGLLIEEARTNLLLWSEAFDNAAWSPVRGSINANATVAPDGTTTAAKYIESADAGAHYVHQSELFASETTVVGSCFFKAAERHYCAISLYDGVSYPTTIFDISGGSVSTLANDDAGIEDIGGGWYRCWVREVIPAGVSTRIQIGVADNTGDSTYTGDGSSGLYIWGAQLEEGSFPTSYIPTEGSAATRNGDVVTLPVSAAPGWNPAEGTFYVEAGTWQPADGYAVANDRAHLFALHDAPGVNALEAFFWSSGLSVFSRKDGGGFTAITPTAGTVPVPGQVVGAAIAYGSDMADMAADGTVVAGLARPFGGSLATAMRLGDGRGVIGRQLNGHIRRLAIYPRRLSPAQLQALTATGGSALTSAAYDSGTIPAGVVPGYGQAIHVLPADVSGQCLRVDIDDPANPDGSLRIGLAYGGPVFQPEAGIAAGSSLEREQGGIEVVTRGGQEYVAQDWQRRAWTIECDVLEEAEAMDGILELDRIARAGRNVLLIPRPDSPYLAREAVFGRLKETSSIGFHHQDATRRTWRGRMTERL